MRMSMRALSRACGLALAATVAGLTVSAPARAGDVKVDIDLTNGVTILYYHSTLTVSLNAASLIAPATGCTGSNPYECADTPSAAPTGTTYGANVVATYAAPATPTNGSINPAAVPLVLQNVWALRALGGSSSNTTVRVDVGTGATLNNGSSSIAITGVDIGTTVGTLTFAANRIAMVADPGLGTPLNGFVALQLNLSNALALGTYSNANPQYTITVTGT